MPTITLTQNDDIFAFPGTGANEETIFGGEEVGVTVTDPGSVEVDVDANGTGNDSIAASFGNDAVYGGDSSDQLDGEAGDDTLYGGSGDDTAAGGVGNDALYGGNDGDTLDGGSGADTLYGGRGDDDLVARSGDVAFGGAGDDEFTVKANQITSPDAINIFGGETEEEALIDDGNNPTLADGGSQVGDTLNVRLQSGVTADVLYGGGNDEAGSVNIVDNAGATISTVNFAEIENLSVACFTRGTLIRTSKGDVSVEDLQVGDLIETHDNGLQPLRWAGSQCVRAKGKRAPVMIKKGALGNDRDLRVSQQHRMLITDWRAELMFGEREVLIAAKHLTNGDMIFIEERTDEVVEYFHLLFDDHQVLTANGCPSESFHPGIHSLRGLAEETKAEILELFPQLASDPTNFGSAARMTLKAFEARALTR